MSRFRFPPFLAAAAFAALGGCVALDNYPSKGDARPHPGVAAAHTMPIQGIDVSSGRATSTGRGAGGRHPFAYIKATEGGDHLDPNFPHNW